MGVTFHKPNNKITVDRVVITSFLVDLSDIIFNLFVALITGSVTMLAQALEGGADLLSSGLLLIGVRRSKHRADRQHPYGYGREIYFWTFLSGLATFSIAATLSFFWGLNHIINPEPVRHIFLAHILLVFSIGTNGYAAYLSYKRLLGAKSIRHFLNVFNHSALIETKTTLVLDVMGTSASILGLLALYAQSVTGIAQFDGVGAMATGLVLGFFALFILRGAKELLVGQSAPTDIEEQIKRITLSFEKVKKIIDFRTLQIDPETIIVNMEVHLYDGLTTDEIELFVDQIEKKIQHEVPHAKHIQIELETPDT